jgi:hypothetical protein
MREPCHLNHDAVRDDVEYRQRNAYPIGEMLGLRLVNCRECKTTLSVATERVERDALSVSL